MLLSTLLLLPTVAFAALSTPHRRHHARMAADKRQAISVEGTLQPLLDLPGSGNPKTVVAHHMVGNTYSYQQSDWLSDIQLAASKGLDAFALNVGSDSWQPARVGDAYAAAAQYGSGFKLFVSLDMSVLPCGSPSDAQNLLNTWIRPYTGHGNQFFYQGKQMVSTFSGESCQFGQGSVQQGWQSQVTSQANIFFAPAFFGDQGVVAANVAVDGYFNWNSAWNVQPFYSAILDSTALSVLDAVQKPYIAAVSPHFFTHYGANTYNKNWVWASDTFWLANRWAEVVSQRDSFDIVELVTWNDYGESSYLGPTNGDFPDYTNWVSSKTFDHTPLLDIVSYYSTAFKTGSAPSIDKDAVYIWMRPHMAGDNIPADPVGQPEFASSVQDVIACLVFATDAGSLTLSAGSGSSSSQTFNVKAGVNQFTIPMVVGSGMYAALERNGQTVVTADGGGYTVDGNPQAYNFNINVVGAQAS